MTQLEDTLRATLHRQAAHVPEDAVTRIAARDYHPRTRRIGRPAALGATGLAAAAGGTGAVLALLGGAAPAFAGWSAHPTAPAAGQITSAESQCAQHMPSQSSLPLKLSDIRGPFTFQIYGDDRSSQTCITGPSFTAASAASSTVVLDPATGAIEVDEMHQVDEQGDAYSFADGRAGSGVTGVTLTLKDGRTVTATVQNGWFVAWWPGDTAATSAQLATSSGTRTQAIPATPQPPAGGSGLSTSSSLAGSGSAHGTVTASSSVSGPGPAPGTSTQMSTTRLSGSGSGPGTTTGGGN